MATDSISKRCSHCKEIKPTTSFRRNRRAKDGFHNQCKECEREYKQSPAGRASKQASEKRRGQKPHVKALQRASSRRFYHSDKGQLYYWQYRRTERNKQSQKAYAQTPKGKANRRKCGRKTAQKYPERNRARDAIKYAVRKGRLPRVRTQKCQMCEKTAQVYHHYLGYAIEHRLDVIPLCYIHHKSLHLISRRPKLAG